MSETNIQPTIHLNGTGRETLQEEAVKASTALRVAHSALQGLTVHPQDYYDDDDKAYQAARTRRNEMLRKLEDAFWYIDERREHLFDNG